MTSMAMEFILGSRDPDRIGCGRACRIVHRPHLVCLIGVLLMITIPCVTAMAQTFAIVEPADTEQGRELTERLRGRIIQNVRVVDLGLSLTAFRSNSPEDPYNLASEAAMDLGSAIGCRFYVILRTATVRRSSFERKEYYEAFAVYYLVSSKTGRLIFWKLDQLEDENPKVANEKLLEQVSVTAGELLARARQAEAVEQTGPPKGQPSEDLPDEGEDAKLRPPMPYLRIKPEYTKLADYFGISAVIDVIVAIDESGAVTGTEIVRWAGFGLDESVDKAVKSMNWRPADRNGNTLPMRVLLRYNFRELAEEDN